MSCVFAFTMPGWPSWGRAKYDVVAKLGQQSGDRSVLYTRARLIVWYVCCNMASGSWIQMPCEARLCAHSFACCKSTSVSLCYPIIPSEIGLCKRDVMVACSSGGSLSVIAGREGCSDAGHGSLLSASAT